MAVFAGAVGGKDGVPHHCLHIRMLLGRDSPTGLSLLVLGLGSCVIHVVSEPPAVLGQGPCSLRPLTEVVGYVLCLKTLRLTPYPQGSLILAPVNGLWG